MKALHVYSGNLYGGVETALVTIAKSSHFTPEIEHHFALSFHGKLETELRKATPHIHYLGAVRLRSPSSVFAARRKLKNIAAGYDAMVFHSTWSQAVFGKQKTPSALWLHARVSGYWLDRLALRCRPHLVICNSRYTQESVPRTLVSQVVYCPVELPDIAPRRRPRPVVIMVARIESGKGHAVLLNALARLNDLDYECWIVGGAQRPSELVYYDALKEQARRLKLRVEFLGEQSDVHELLEQADIFCQPNTGPEGFGLTFIEAINAGLPVVTSSIGGALEIVDDSCGILIEPGNVEALATALRELLTDKEKRERHSNRTHASELVNPRQQMKQIASALRSIG